MRVIKSVKVILLSSLFISPVYGAVKGNVDVFLSGNTGNAHTRTFSVKNDTQKDLDQFTIKGKVNYFSNMDNHKLESEKYLFNQQFDWRYRDHPVLDYFFQRYTWDKDRSKKIRSRSALGLGHGFDILEIRSRVNHRVTLILELGGDYVWEQRRDASYEEYGSFRSYSVLDYLPPGDKTEIKQDFEYLLDFGGTFGYRINTITSIKRNLKKQIGLKLAFEVNYDSTPIGTAKTTDTQTNLYLSIKY